MNLQEHRHIVMPVDLVFRQSLTMSFNQYLLAVCFLIPQETAGLWTHCYASGSCFPTVTYYVLFNQYLLAVMFSDSSRNCMTIDTLLCQWIFFSDSHFLDCVFFNQYSLALSFQFPQETAGTQTHLYSRWILFLTVTFYCVFFNQYSPIKFSVFSRNYMTIDTLLCQWILFSDSDFLLCLL